jgi:DNA-binding CsgD family transcriptional regulator/PAS domain-containing protein
MRASITAQTLMQAATVETVHARALSALIGSIYDCALHPDRWDQTLVGISDAFECANALLTLSDLRHNRILISKSVGIEPYWQERIASHAPEINAKLGKALASWPHLDTPFVISRDVPAAEIDASPYYQECYRGQGLVDALQYILMHTPERFSGFALGRHGQRGVITEREIELGELLLPHIRRAVTISNVLDARTIEQARMAQALDALQCGVVLTDRCGAILHANRSAEEMLRNGSPVGGAGGVLSAKTAAANKELSSAIRLAAQDEATIGKAGLAIRLVQPGEPPHFAHVLPMSGSEMRTRLQPAAVAAVFIAKPEGGHNGAVFAAAFGLTPAETEVLASLLAGRTRDETAIHLAISLATIKTHLLNIFAKTGVRRQAELIRLVSRVLPPISSGR